ncbi:7282_t:CDS:1, partial [Cetraspora pellucida]
MWRFDRKYWSIPGLKSDIIQELQSIQDTAANWDLHKCSIQSIIRSFKPRPSPEKRIQKIHRKICSLNNKLAKNPNLEELNLVIEGLNFELQEELTMMSDKWRVRSNAKWIEEGE